MPQTIDRIDFACTDVDPSQWPKLSCGEANQLLLAAGSLRLEADRALLFQDNGQLRSFDDTHRLVFDRVGGLLELHEAGAIRFLTGSPIPTEKLRILATGQVGIGTATPTSLLHVTGDIRTDGALRVAGHAAVGGTLTVSSTVGIGTSTPTQTLEVVGTVKATGFQGSGAELTGVRGTDSTKVAKVGDTMTGALAISAAGTGLRITHDAAVGGTLTIGGHVGIGTISPGQALDVVGQGLFRSAHWAGAVPGVAGTVIGFDPSNAGGTGFLWSHTTTGAATRLWMDGNPIIFAPAGAERMRVDSGGNVGIGTMEPREKLEVNGSIVVTGDIQLPNADCAEDFDICEAERVEPGTVMVLGEEGKLEQSQKAYDKRVAGVVSGAGDYKPGIVLDKQQSSNTRKPIALLGKVYCKADAEHGVIEIGDLLTTSPTPGHAMKADDPLKAFGTVIGKALRPLAVGQGLIPILIALQ